MKLIRREGIAVKSDAIVVLIFITQVVMITLVFGSELELLPNVVRTLTVGLPVVMLVIWIFFTVKIVRQR